MLKRDFVKVYRFVRVKVVYDLVHTLRARIAVVSQ
jgi:hypothetical protein